MFTHLTLNVRLAITAAQLAIDLEKNNIAHFGDVGVARSLLRRLTTDEAAEVDADDAASEVLATFEQCFGC